MGEDALWESLPGGGSSQGGGESEGLADRQEGSDDVKRSTGDLFLFVDNTSSLIEDGVDSSHGVSWTGDLTDEDRFLKSWLGGELGCIIDSSGGRDDLTTSSVDGVGVQGDVQDVDSNSSHVLVTEDGFLGCPLESGFT